MRHEGKPGSECGDPIWDSAFRCGSSGPFLFNTAGSLQKHTDLAADAAMTGAELVHVTEGRVCNRKEVGSGWYISMEYPGCMAVFVVREGASR